MRYHLFWHIREEELAARSPEWSEEVMAFLTVFKGQLELNSELDWTDVYAPESQSVVVSPAKRILEEHYNEDAKAVRQVWAIRVASFDRAVEIAHQLAGELDTWIEVREVLEGAQRP